MTFSDLEIEIFLKDIKLKAWTVNCVMSCINNWWVTYLGVIHEIFEFYSKKLENYHLYIMLQIHPVQKFIFKE